MFKQACLYKEKEGGDNGYGDDEQWLASVMCDNRHRWCGYLGGKWYSSIRTTKPWDLRFIPRMSLVVEELRTECCSGP